MKKILLEYANYNHWANKQFTDVIINLPDDALHHKTNASFESIYKTLLHLWDVETLWWKRIKLEEAITFPSGQFEGSLVELIKGLLIQSKEWYKWIDNTTEHGLMHEFIYRNSKKEQFKQPVCEVLMHLFNHQTFHRGQLVTLLHENGIHKIPHSGFIEFTRSK